MTTSNYNPEHPIGTCAKCGGEMVYNVPRPRPSGGCVHKESGRLERGKLSNTTTVISESDQAYEIIKNWQVTNPVSDTFRLIEFIKQNWDSNYGKVIEEVTGTISFITGGWSENEVLISAMQENVIFWSLTWQSSHRGGLHVFKITV